MKRWLIELQQNDGTKVTALVFAISQLDAKHEAARRYPECKITAFIFANGNRREVK